nr:putative ribonuclease H-like domain-containing protein [Tanacetum cinerariifolium]
MDKCKTELGYNVVPPPYTGNFIPPKPDLVYPSLDAFVDVNESVSKSIVEKPTVESNEPKTVRKENGAQIIKDWVSESDSKRNMVPRTVLTRSGPISLNTARPVNTVQTRIAMNNARPIKNIINNAYSTARRPINNKTTSKNSKINQKGNPHQDLKDKGVIVSGCSRHMTGNISYLTNYKEIDVGFVAFGGNSKRAKNTGKGKIRTGKLDFEDVYFVKELKFNLFSVSQMCDKKNSILFTDTACVVLSPDFKLTDESRKHALSFMRPFGYSVTILNTIDHLGKFDGKADEGFFVGYSTNSKAFRVFNSRTRIVEENLHVKFSENTPNIVGSRPNWLFDIDALTKSMNYKPVVAGNQSNGSAGTKACDNVGKTRVETVPDKDYILLPLWTQDLLFSSSLKDSPRAGFKQSGKEGKKNAKDPGNEDSEVPSTKEPRVNQEKYANVNNSNNTVIPTDNATSIEDNVIDENIVYGFADNPNIPNLEEMADLGHIQEEGIDYDEVFAPVERIEAIRLFLAYASFKDFVVYQMDVKSAFLYGKIEEEVYVCQPLRFEDPDFPNKFYKVEKALYGLHQAPRAWSTRKEMCIEFEKMMHKKFQTSSMGELTFFLGLQVKQKEDWIFISQDKYMNEILNKFSFSYVKTTSTPMETHKTLFNDEKGEDVDEHLYRSMIGSLMYLTSSRPDIMFATVVANSTTKAEDSNEKKLIQMIKIHTNKNVADLLTKAFDVGLSTRVESFDKVSLGEKDASKQGRDIVDIDARKEIILVDETAEDQGRFDDQEMFHTGVLDDEVVVVEKAVADKEVIDVEEVNAASIVTSAAATTTTAATTPTISMDETTLAKALIEINTSRPKAKEIVMQEPSETPTPTPIVSSQQPSKVKDKEERLASEKNEANNAVLKQWHDVQAKIKADYELAQRLQEEEQEQLTDDEKARLFMVNMFMDMDTEVVESSKKTKEIAQEGSSKRAGDELEQEIAKTQRIEDENESTELKRCLEIIPGDGDDVTIDATPLSSKSSTIVDYKIYKEGRKSFF